MSSIDLQFRPGSYWDASDPLTAILANIKGENRRQMAVTSSPARHPLGWARSILTSSTDLPRSPSSPWLQLNFQDLLTLGKTCSYSVQKLAGC